MGHKERSGLIKQGRNLINSTTLNSEESFLALQDVLVIISDNIVDDYEEQRSNFDSDKLLENWEEKTGYQQKNWESAKDEIEEFELADFNEDWDDVRSALQDIWTGAQS